MATENYCVYHQVAFDTVIKHFAAKEIKPTFKEYDAAMSKMFVEEVPAFDNPIEEEDYWDYMSNTYENKMQEYFGSDYDKKEGGKLEEFKNKCFVASNNGTIKAIAEQKKKDE